MGPRQIGEVLVEDGGVAFIRVGRLRDQAHPMPDPVRLRARRVSRGFGDQIEADLYVHLDILPGLDALEQVGEPGPEMIHPAFDGVAVASGGRDDERREPAVVAQRLHRHHGPGVLILALFLGALFFPPMKQARGDLIVAVPENGGLHFHHIRDHTLDRETAAIDFRRDALHHHPSPLVRLP